MSITLVVKVEGLDAILDTLKRAPQVSAKELSAAVRKSVCIDLDNSIRREAPVNKSPGITGGTLKQKITSRMTTALSGEISADAPYSAFVHEGTAPHEIRPKSIGYKGHKGGLANKYTGWGVFNRVMHPGTRPNPFMTRGVEKAAKKVEANFNKALDRILKFITGK